MDLEQIASYWARFHLSFSWDYPEGLDLQAVQQAVFHVVGEADGRSQDQLVVGSVQSAGAGVVLTQPVPVSDNVPCELSFTAHPMSDEFCVKNIVIVSEARNVELYVDGCYAKTARGIMLTIKKGNRKVSLFETEFDLSEYVRGKCRCTVKFLSFPQPKALRIQTIVVKVAKRPTSTVPGHNMPAIQNIIPGSVDLVSVKEFIKSSGKELTPEAEKLLASMEQMQWAQGVQMRQTRPRSRSADAGAEVRNSKQYEQNRFSIASDGSLLQQAISRARELEEEEQYNRMEPVGSPETKEEMINRLAGLMIDRSNRRENTVPLHNGHDMIPNGDRHPEELAQARWEAYVQSRLRSGRPGDQPIAKQTTSYSSNSTPSLHGHVIRCDERDSDRHRGDSPPTTGGATKVSSAPELGLKSRCVSCGCPGCLSVYNSISTNIYATEERIMAKVEQQVQQLQRHVDSQFDALYQSLQLRQEQLIAHALQENSLPHVPGALPGRRISSGFKVGDTSV